MSSIDVKKSFTTPLLKELNSNTSLRDQLEGQTGQLLILSGNVTALQNVIESSLNVKASNTLLRKALRAARNTAASLEARFASRSKRRVNSIYKRLEKDGILADRTLVRGKSLFVVQSFNSSISKVKEAMLAVIFKELNIKEGDSKRQEMSFKLQKGHGEQGYAVSQVQVAKTFAKAAQLEGGSELLKTNFDSFLQGAKLNEETRKEYLGHF
jgi:hypothetical protein